MKVYPRYAALIVMYIFCLFQTAEVLAAERASSLGTAKIVQITGTEHISENPKFEIEFGFSTRTVTPASELGKTLSVQLSGDRRVSGLITSIVETETGFRVQLESPLIRLISKVQNRTFYDATVPAIIGEILEDSNIQAYEMRLQSSYSPGMYTQYQESDYDFISRLMQHAGIHYHFESTSDGDKLIFADDNSGFPLLSNSTLTRSNTESPAVSSFHQGLSLYPGKIRTSAYTWSLPMQTVSGDAQSMRFLDLTREFTFAAMDSTSTANELAERLVQIEETDAQHCGGSSTYTTFRPGYRFYLSTGENGSKRTRKTEYLITKVTHEGMGDSYRNTFDCVAASVTYRDPFKTAVPTISGIVSGIVTAPAGEKVQTDQYGRIKIRFPWRRQQNQNSESGDAGWVRVLQPAAGKNGGAFLLPQAGDEVAVAFEFGDPDRPVVLGSLYNTTNSPPLSLPQDKWKTVISQTSNSGKQQEISINNSSGSEGITIRSGNHYLRITPGGISTNSVIAQPEADGASPTKRSIGIQKTP